MNTTSYDNLTPKAAWLLAAPHTWPASIFPVLMAVAFAYANGRTVSWTIAIALLAASVLLQSAVNTLNDYFDFVKGSDTAADNVDVDDAVLVYHNIRPTSARNLAFGFIVAALGVGAYCVWYAGWVPLAVAVVGIAIVFLYSGGRTPISYLPIGEAISGVVMGALITFASYVTLTRSVDWLVLLWSVPLVIGIGLIMMTNNTCDREKDEEAGRHTVPVIVGRPVARSVYHVLVGLWCAAIVVIDLVWFTSGVLILPFMLLASYPILKALLANPLEPSSRIAAMSQICSANIALGAFYCASICASGMPITIL